MPVKRLAQLPSICGECCCHCTDNGVSTYSQQQIQEVPHSRANIKVIRLPVCRKCEVWMQVLCQTEFYHPVSTRVLTAREFVSTTQLTLVGILNFLKTLKTFFWYHWWAFLRGEDRNSASNSEWRTHTACLHVWKWYLWFLSKCYCSTMTFLFSLHETV